MKFLHLGDLHLGKTLGDFHLWEDQRYMLTQILELLKKESIDAVLLAGDIYDKSIPSEAATGLLDFFLSSLSSLHIKTFLISGNHDSDERLNFGSTLFEKNQIYIAAKYNGILYKQILTDSWGELTVYLLPFVKASQVRQVFPEEKIETYEDAVKAILAHADIDPNKRNILIAHQFVAGSAQNPILGGSEGMAVKNVGLVEQIGYRCFDVFDYVALGHIHSPQRVGREEVRYAGSMLKYSLSEAHNTKSVTIVTMEQKGKVTMEQVVLPPLRDIRHIKGPMETLLKKENIHDTQDFIYATLTNEEIVNDAMSIFQQIYPNTVKIDYDNSHTKELDLIDITKITEHKTFSDLITEFYNQMYGCDISDEELKLMREIAAEVGVADETS